MDAATYTSCHPIERHQLSAGSGRGALLVGKAVDGDYPARHPASYVKSESSSETLGGSLVFCYISEEFTK